MSASGLDDNVNAVVEPFPLNILCVNAPPVVTLAKLFISMLELFGGASEKVKVDPFVEYVPFS